ncbi:hypothetical protein CYMTET_48898, partial [Cymbomonas tetramitiformis]
LPYGTLFRVKTQYSLAPVAQDYCRLHVSFCMDYYGTPAVRPIMLRLASDGLEEFSSDLVTVLCSLLPYTRAYPPPAPFSPSGSSCAAAFASAAPESLQRASPTSPASQQEPGQLPFDPPATRIGTMASHHFPRDEYSPRLGGSDDLSEDKPHVLMGAAGNAVPPVARLKSLEKKMRSKTHAEGWMKSFSVLVVLVAMVGVTMWPRQVVDAWSRLRGGTGWEEEKLSALQRAHLAVLRNEHLPPITDRRFAADAWDDAGQPWIGRFHQEQIRQKTAEGDALRLGSEPNGTTSQELELKQLRTALSQMQLKLEELEKELGQCTHALKASSVSPDMRPENSVQDELGVEEEANWDADGAHLSAVAPGRFTAAAGMPTEAGVETAAKQAQARPSPERHRLAALHDTVPVHGGEVGGSAREAEGKEAAAAEVATEAVVEGAAGSTARHAEGSALPQDVPRNPVMNSLRSTASALLARMHEKGAQAKLASTLILNRCQQTGWGMPVELGSAVRRKWENAMALARGSRWLPLLWPRFPWLLPLMGLGAMLLSLFCILKAGRRERVETPTPPTTPMTPSKAKDLSLDAYSQEFEQRLGKQLDKISAELCCEMMTDVERREIRSALFGTAAEIGHHMSTG